MDQSTSLFSSTDVNRNIAIPASSRAIAQWGWYFIGGVNVLLVAMTVLIKYLTSTFPGYSVLGLFNLAWENNVAAWWSSMNLLLIALLGYELFSRRARGLRWTWFAIMFAYLALSWDEMGSFHERIQGGKNLVPFALALGVPMAGALLALLRNPDTRQTAKWLLIGALLMASAVLYEYVEHAVTWPDWTDGIRFGLEEGSEILGMFIVLVSLSWQRRYPGVDLSASPWPSPRLLIVLPVLAAVGLVLSAILMLVPFADVSPRGDPSIWFTAAMFLVPTLYALHRAARDWRWWLPTLVCAAVSLSTALLLPSNYPHVQDLSALVYVGYLLPLALLAAYFAIEKSLTAAGLLTLGVVIAAIILTMLLVPAASSRLVPALAAFGLMLVMAAAQEESNPR